MANSINSTHQMTAPAPTATQEATVVTENTDRALTEEHVHNTPRNLVKYSYPLTSKTTGSAIAAARVQSPLPSPLITSIHPQPNSQHSWSPFSSSSVSPGKSPLLDLRINVISNWLRQKQLEKQWSISEVGEGVLIRKSKGCYVCSPPDLQTVSSCLYEAIHQLNVKCAMTINTRTTKLMLECQDLGDIPLGNGLCLQVLPDLYMLPKCHKNQSAAFIQDPPILIVWDDDPAHIIDRVEQLEQQMMSFIWQIQMNVGNDENHQSSVASVTDIDNNSGELQSNHISPRKMQLLHPCIVAATLIIMCVALGAGWRNIAIEAKVQKSWLCLLFPVAGPIQAWLGLFFFQTLPTCIAQVFGPVHQMKENSTFYTGRTPNRTTGRLPHVTVQCPVYKESLATVIGPTIRSIEAAILTYEMQGGTANIFINDDGMQLIAEEQAQLRREFYEEHNIGWVARPKHNMNPAPNEEAFQRAGKFKKASNMNYGLSVSVRVEDKLSAMARPAIWTVDQECAAYDEALATILAKDKGRTWANGNIRVGDYILLIDSDTRVPQDCLLGAVSEMELSADVAIVQFSSGVMNVTNSWFEKGITFFTNLVYTSIEFAVANGDVAPFVGHNAFLRWSAIQDVASVTLDKPNYYRFWSEDTVSEDFEMALRLQTSGYNLRLAAYANGGFKEGVSLTVYDELARWEKYAYGCSELIFNPLFKWPFRGPFTPMFRRFIFSSMPFHSKISIMAYIGTYFAIASSWLLTLLNYFLVGWYNGYLDHYYVESFRMYFSIIVVFNFIGSIALAVLRYRTKAKDLIPALIENFKWVPLLTTFLGGISLHVSQAILCHLFSINITWEATNKEATDTSFFREIPIILRRFRFTFIFCFAVTCTIVVLSGVGPFNDIVPYHWQITTFTAIFPLGVTIASHALMPLALNPGLMQFTF